VSFRKNAEKINSTTVRSMKKVKVLAFTILFIFLNVFALRNFYLLSKDMVYGDFSAQQLIPQPIYTPGRIPETSITMRYQAVNRLAGDFAQIYFPAQDISSMENAYDHKATLDPWGRPSRYAPTVLGLCALTLCKLDYGYASFANILLQLMLFIVILYFVYRSLALKDYFWPSLLLMEFCLFLTPVGLSWFERGQFSLYVGLSILLLLLGLIRKNAILIFLSALSAFIKWTSLPIAFVILVVFLLNSNNARKFRFGIFVAALFALVFALLLLPYIRESVVFVKGLLSQELMDNPTGLSLSKFLPRYVVKLIPLLAIIFGYLNIRIGKNTFVSLIPYIAGVTTILLIYPTRANDYSIPTLLGLIPLMLFWVTQLRSDQQVAGNIITALFLLFLIVASFSTLLTHSILIMVIIYIVFSTILITSPSILAFHGARQKP
jgi:hypothetical protein